MALPLVSSALQESQSEISLSPRSDAATQRSRTVELMTSGGPLTISKSIKVALVLVRSNLPSSPAANFPGPRIQDLSSSMTTPLTIVVMVERVSEEVVMSMEERGDGGGVGKANNLSATPRERTGCPVPGVGWTSLP
ncbi:hypothetical protein Tco_0921339 [Tanacetum coccineum]